MRHRVIGVFFLAALAGPTRAPAADAPLPGLVVATLDPGGIHLGGPVEAMGIRPRTIRTSPPASAAASSSSTRPPTKSSSPSTCPPWRRPMRQQGRLRAVPRNRAVRGRGRPGRLGRRQGARRPRFRQRPLPRPRCRGRQAHPQRPVQAPRSRVALPSGLAAPRIVQSSPAFAVSPDGRYIAKVVAQAGVRVYDIGAKKFLDATLKGHDLSPTLLAFAADGKTLFSAGPDGLAIEWAADKAQPVRITKGTDGSSSLWPRRRTAGSWPRRAWPTGRSASGTARTGRELRRIPLAPFARIQPTPWHPVSGRRPRRRVGRAVGPRAGVEARTARPSPSGPRPGPGR